MGKDVLVSVKIDSTLKKKAEKILEELGLTLQQAISLLFKQIVLRKGLPFELRTSGRRGSRCNRDVLQEADAIENAENFSALDDQFNNFDIR